jgi:heptosyltransferase-1
LHTQSNFRLLVVRLGAMGDILHALPAVTALRLAHPTWQIGWVVEPHWEPLLRARNTEQGTATDAQPATAGGPATTARSSVMPVVDRIHFAPTRQWKRHPLNSGTIAEIKTLRRELRAAGYHAVLDLQGAIRSAVIARISGCSRRVGEAAPREWPAHWLFSERIATHGAHVIEQDVELASAIAGDALAPAEPLLPVDAESENWCDARFAPPTAYGRQQPVALITPGAGWGAKRWPPERYAEVARGLAARGMRVVVNCGPGEEPLAEPIAVGGAAELLTATLPQLIALTRRIALCIGGDTGPLHLACALNRPVVGIYGPTAPSRNGPFGTRAVVLRNPQSRVDHSRRAAPDPGLLTIEPQEVLSAADQLLTRETRQ